MSKITFRYLSEPDMIAAGVTDMAACIDAMDEAFTLMGAGDYRLAGTENNSHGAWLMFPDDPPFAGMPKNGPDRRFMAMPAYLGGAFGLTGVKWYGSNAENKDKGLPRSILLFVLNDTDTGAPIAIMSANLLSAVRTGAVPGLGAKYFAPADARVLSIVGPGVMNRTSLDAFMAIRPQIDTIKLQGRSRRGIDSFKELVAARYPSVTSVIEADSIEETVRDGDIISVAVSAPSEFGSEHYPLLKREWVKPGAFVSLPASARTDEALCAPDVLKVVDIWGQYEEWAEAFPHPHHNHVGIIGNYWMDLIETGKLAKEEVVEMGHVAGGQAPGRTSDDQIVVFSIGGLPMEDVAWASHVYDRACAEGIGTELLLWDSPALA